MEISKLIDEIVNCETADKKKIIKLLMKGIQSKCEEKDICEEIYKESYGDVLIPSLCEELISKMSNGEKSGAVWNLEDTNSVAKKIDIDFESKPYTPEEFRTVMTMEYYEHSIPLKKCGVVLEPTGWGRLADYALTNDPKKLVNYYFN